MSVLKAKLIEKIEQIQGLENRPSPVAGGSALFYKGKEIAHFHHDNELDVRLTRKIIKLEKLEHPLDSMFHSRKKTSEWIELRFYDSKQINEIIRLLKIICRD